MKNMKMKMKTLGRKVLRKLVRNDEGLETVEYAIIAGLIVVGTIVSVTAIGIWVGAQFTTMQTLLGA